VLALREAAASAGEAGSGGRAQRRQRDRPVHRRLLRNHLASAVAGAGGRDPGCLDWPHSSV
jgi:hypothetical protein